MKGVDISVIVTTYNPNIQRIKETLYSIFLQEQVSYEIILADDGSTVNYKNEISAFFERFSFKDFYFAFLDENCGTVKNLLNSLEYCHGKYIKAISPGDFLYDKFTLRDWFDYLERKNCIFSFARYATYSPFADSLESIIKTVKLGNRPYDLSVYIPHVNNHMVKYKYLLLDDYCVGATVMARTAEFKEYLSKLDGKVKYAEDAALRYMISDDKMPCFFDRLTIWYSLGDGISTNGKTKWRKILYKDHYEAGLVIRNCLCGKDWFNKRYRLFLLLSKHVIIKAVFKYFLFPSLFICRLKKDSNVYAKEIDESLLVKILQLKTDSV